MKNDKINQIINYLETYGPASKSEIYTALKIGKSTASNYFKELAEKGLINGDIPVGGLVTLKKSSPFPKMKVADTQYALILLAIDDSDVALSVNKIEDNLRLIMDIADETDEPVESIFSNLRTHLKALTQQGFLVETTELRKADDRTEKELLCYKKTPSAPSIGEASFGEISDFLSIYKNYSVSSEIEDFVDKLQWVTDYDMDDSVNQVVYGKKNVFKETSIKHLSRIFGMQYRTKALNIEYVSRNGAVACTLEIGAILYSGETNEFYLYGKNIETLEYILIRISSIYKVEESEIENTIFGCDEVKAKTDAMVSIEGGEPFNVKIRFRNQRWNKERLEQFIKTRKNAQLQTNKDGTELVLTEEGVIGLNGMHRFVRSFGPNAIVEEPEELVNLMMGTIEHVSENYGG